MLEAPKVLLTLPLSLLKAQQGGAIQFTPRLPEDKWRALDKLEMGKVIRVVLRFRERFWETIKPSARSKKTLSNMAFLFRKTNGFQPCGPACRKRVRSSRDGRHFVLAEQLSGQSESFITDCSLQTLSELLATGAGTANSSGTRLRS